MLLIALTALCFGVTNIILGLYFPLGTLEKTMGQTDKILEEIVNRTSNLTETVPGYADPTCLTTNVTALRACVEAGTCVGGNPTGITSLSAVDITSGSELVVSVGNAGTCTTPLAASCIPQSLVQNRVNVTNSILLGATTMCTGLLPQTCFDISNQGCAAGQPLQDDCWYGNISFAFLDADQLYVNGVPVNLTGAVSTGSNSSVPLDISSLLEIDNTTQFASPVTCSTTRPFDSASGCIELGSSTQCATPLADACVPANIDLQNSTISSSLVINSFVCNATSPATIDQGCLPTDLVYRIPNNTIPLITTNSLIRGPDSPGYASGGFVTKYAGAFGGTDPNADYSLGGAGAMLTGPQNAVQVSRLALFNVSSSMSSPTTNDLMRIDPITSEWTPVAPELVFNFSYAGDFVGPKETNRVTRIGRATLNATNLASPPTGSYMYVNPLTQNTHSVTTRVRTNSTYYAFGLMRTPQGYYSPNGPPNGTPVYFVATKGTSYFNGSHYMVQEPGLYRVRVGYTARCQSYLGLYGSSFSEMGLLVRIASFPSLFGSRDDTGERMGTHSGQFDIPSYRESTLHAYATTGDMLFMSLDGTFCQYPADKGPREFIEIVRISST